MTQHVEYPGPNRKVSKTLRATLWLFVGLLLPTIPISANESAPPPAGAQAPLKINLPYAFYNGSFGASAGYIFGISGYPQKQSVLFGTAFAGTAGSGMLMLLGKDIRLLGLDRVMLNSVLSIAYYGEFDTYIDGNPDYPDDRAGSNSSDIEDNIRGKGWDGLVRLRVNYLLPLGHGRDQVIDAYQLDRGLLKTGATGSESWNPIASGKAFLGISPFFRSISIQSDDLGDAEIKTNGIDLDFNWDNRDYPPNPSRGHGLVVRASRDFGLFESSRSWTAWQLELDKYISLGSNSWLRQGVIALDLWTSLSPTWEESASGALAHNPPPFAGASLGGFWRMRGYPNQRFYDKAAIYYCVELRLIPEWNPFDSWSWLRKHLGVQWVQFVPFVEVGRVAPQWDANDLLEDLKWDAGLGTRFCARGMVLRIDTAFSEEDYWIQMMVGQPFHF